MNQEPVTRCHRLTSRRWRAGLSPSRSIAIHVLLAACLPMIPVAATSAVHGANSPRQTTKAQDFALFDQRFGRADKGNSSAVQIIARARAALARPVPPVPAPLTGPVQANTGMPAMPRPPAGGGPGSPGWRFGGGASALDLALAWRLTGDRAYLDQASRYLDAWSTSYSWSLVSIQETGMDWVVLSYDLTRHDLPAAKRVKIESFIRRMTVEYLESIEKKTVPILPTLVNNWQSHRIKLVTLGAFELADPDLIARAHAIFSKQLAANLNSDGSTLDFHQRDALHYVVYDLEPLLTAALVAKAHGEDWYHETSPTGSSLPHTLDWFSRFATGDEKHVEFVHSVVPIDKQRADTGIKTYQPHEWEPVTSVRVFMLATLLDPRFQAVRDKLMASAGDFTVADSPPNFDGPVFQATWLTMLSKP